MTAKRAIRSHFNFCFLPYVQREHYSNLVLFVLMLFSILSPSSAHRGRLATQLSLFYKLLSGFQQETSRAVPCASSFAANDVPEITTLTTAIFLRSLCRLRTDSNQRDCVRESFVFYDSDHFYYVRSDRGNMATIFCRAWLIYFLVQKVIQLILAKPYPLWATSFIMSAI